MKSIKDNLSSIEYWYYLVTNQTDKVSSRISKDLMFLAIQKERPNLLSLILERSCILQCRHCLFQKEKSSQQISKKINLEKISLNIIKQMPTKSDAPNYDNPLLIHEGRTLRGWHVEVLKKFKVIRPDIRVGLIDNGNCLRYVDEFKKNNFKLDWLDVSIDGTKEIHNRQRDSGRAFDMAMHLIKNAKQFVLPKNKGGKIASLFTITNINYDNILKTADMMFDREKLIDELHFTTFSPVRSEIKRIEVSPNYKKGDVSEFKEMWRQIKIIFKRYNTDKKQRIFVRFYQHQDMEKLAKAVGEKKFYKSFFDLRKIKVGVGSVSFTLDGVKILYFPLSIGPSETFIIDADGKYRLAYCLKYTLDELNSNKSKKGQNIKKYTVAQLTQKSSHKKMYKKGVRQWVAEFGGRYFARELKVFREIKNKINK